MSDGVKPYTLAEMDAELGDEIGGPLERQFCNTLGIPATIDGLPNRAAHAFYGKVRRLLATARAGLEDRERLDLLVNSPSTRDGQPVAIWRDDVKVSSGVARCYDGGEYARERFSRHYRASGAGKSRRSATTHTHTHDPALDSPAVKANITLKRGRSRVRKHLRYLSYVVRHKWFVFVAGRKTEAPLWRLLIHDWSKFLPSEWRPYAMFFYGPFRSWPKGPTQDCAENQVRPAFDAAWLKHQHRNPHHWQHWVLREDSGAVKLLPMPEHFVREMVADWMGAGRAITGKWEAGAWYAQNAERIQLENKSRLLAEFLLYRFGGLRPFPLLAKREAA